MIFSLKHILKLIYVGTVRSIIILFWFLYVNNYYLLQFNLMNLPAFYS